MQHQVTRTNRTATPRWRWARASWVGVGCWLLCTQTLTQTLPQTVTTALLRAQIPPDAVSLLVADADGRAVPRLSHRADVQMNPASTMKLVTTFAALDLLGPAYTWRTPVWLDGRVQDGALQGNLVIQGQGDPKLVQERLWLLFQRLQGMGVRQIDGDIVLDHRAFAPPESTPADFDGEPLRPYNVAPDALLFNFKAVAMTFVPDAAANLARVRYDLALSGVHLPAAVPLLVAKNAPCGDYRAHLKADFTDPTRLTLGGSYPLACGEKTWQLAYIDPGSYNARNLEALWRSMGGLVGGQVRDGTAPLTPASFELVSPTLLEVVRDINKYSNNVMAQQVFLSLALPRQTVGESAALTSAAPVKPVTRTMAGEVVQTWWRQRISTADALTIDNGAGLSRTERVSAQGLLKLLQVAYASPTMSELMSSLPIVGVDGTLRRNRATPASAHLKTGSLRDVMALAGYVQGAGGKHLCLVALVNHANASEARPALDALVQWAVSDNATP